MEVTLLEKKLKYIEISLLALRVTISLVFLIWALDKIIAPEHTIAVFKTFYKVEITAFASLLMGLAQLVFVTLLLLGLYRNAVYLIALLFHAASTFSSMAKYFDPFNNLLFFAAWPMLAACLALYLLRELDNLCVIKLSKKG